MTHLKAHSIILKTRDLCLEYDVGKKTKVLWYWISHQHLDRQETQQSSVNAGRFCRHITNSLLIAIDRQPIRDVLLIREAKDMRLTSA